MEPLLNYAWIRWIISCSFSSTCPLPASSYFCFLLMFSLKKKKLYFLARIESSFDEVLYLAVVFIFSLSCLPLKRTKKRKKPWRTGTVATGSEWYRRPPLLNREGRGRARADRAPATETVKVPLGIMQVPDIRRVLKGIYGGPLQMPATLWCSILTTYPQHVSVFHIFHKYHTREHEPI